MYKFKNVGKSIILFQCKISKRILIPLRKTSFKKIGIMALSKDRERADNTSKKDKNATKKNTRLKFVLSKESAFIKVRNWSLNKKYRNKNNRNPIIGIRNANEIN